MSNKKLIVFGATSAIATVVARRWVAEGGAVFCTGRDPSKLGVLLDDLRVRAGGDNGRVLGVQADLLDTDNHENLWQEAKAALGGIDAVLVAHGSLPDQTACEQSVPQMLTEVHTNATSAMALLTLAANHLEAGAVIAAISSVAGDRGRQSNYVYGAAKGMLTLFMQGLRNRLAKKGIAVVTIKPGFVDTPMTAEFDKGGPLWASADQVGTGIVRAMQKRRDVVYLPWFWRYIMLIIRHIPERIFKRMSL